MPPPKYSGDGPNGGSSAATGTSTTGTGTGSPTNLAPPEPPPTKIVELPGASDDLAPSEKAYLTEIAESFNSPCGEPITLETCILEQRPCKLCGPAASTAARLVKQGEYKSDIRKWLELRFTDAALVEAFPPSPSPVFGGIKAPIEIVEFADFECPHCGKVAPMVHALAEKGPIAGKIRIVFKNMPLKMHPHAEPAARAAWAAHQQGRFWPMHDLLFGNQDALGEDDLEGYAKKLGLDLAKWKADFTSQAAKDAIAKDYALGERSGVTGTPSLFINRRRFVPLGSDDFQVQLETWVKTELLKTPG